MLLKVFVWKVYFGGYLNETWHAFIVYMFRRRPEVLHSVGDNALISGFGKGPLTQYCGCSKWEKTVPAPVWMQQLIPFNYILPNRIESPCRGEPHLVWTHLDVPPGVCRTKYDSKTFCILGWRFQMKAFMFAQTDFAQQFCCALKYRKN